MSNIYRDGWFDFETLFTNGGEGGENTIAQETCDGAVGGTVTSQTGYHSARCGYMNIFHYNSNQCTIENIPSF